MTINQNRRQWIHSLKHFLGDWYVLGTMLGSDSPKIIQTSCLAYRNLWSSQGDRAAGGLWGRATLACRRDWICRVNWWPGPRLGFSEAESRPVNAHRQDRILCKGLALTTRIWSPSIPFCVWRKEGRGQMERVLSWTLWDMWGYCGGGKIIPLYSLEFLAETPVTRGRSTTTTTTWTPHRVWHMHRGDTEDNEPRSGHLRSGPRTILEGTGGGVNGLGRWLVP